MFLAEHFRALAISGIACLRTLTETGLLERVVATSDLKDSVEKIEAHCFVEKSSVVIAASMLVWDDIDGV